MRSVSLRLLLLISVVYFVTTKNLTNDTSADNGLSLKNVRRMQNSLPETQKIDQNITFHWKNSYYCLFISSIVLIGSVVFLCYQIKLMRFFFAHITILFCLLNVTILASQLDAKYFFDTSLSWFLIFMVPTTIGVYAAFNHPMFPIQTGGYNMMFSFCLLIGHIMALASKEDARYGLNHPVIYGFGLCCGCIGFIYGWMTILQYKNVNSVKCATFMRNMLFSCNIAFGFADSLCLIMDNEIVASQLLIKYGDAYIKAIQITWVSSYAVFLALSQILSQTILKESRPLFPYNKEKLDQLSELETDILEALVEAISEEKSMTKRLRTRSTEDLDEIENSSDCEKVHEFRDTAEETPNQLHEIKTTKETPMHDIL